MLNIHILRICAGVAELVDALDSKSCFVRSVGSNPTTGTSKKALDSSESGAFCFLRISHLKIRLQKVVLFYDGTVKENLFQGSFDVYRLITLRIYRTAINYTSLQSLIHATNGQTPS